MLKPTCSVPECAEPAKGRGWCRRHYNRWHYSGSPTPWSSPTWTCALCETPFEVTASGKHPKFCSRSCQTRESYARRAAEVNAKRVAKTKAARVEKQCPCCGVAFTPEKSARQVFCSRRCSKRMQNAGRRAKTRGAFVEPLHWRMLFDEDGAGCHICGYDTDPADYELTSQGHRLYGPGYPTLDHVTPLSGGGLHERSNALLAHLYCNTVKGARSLETVS